MRKLTQIFFAVVILLSCYSMKLSAQALNFGAYSYITLSDILPNNQSYTKEAWIKVYNYQSEHGCNILSAWDHPFWIENGVLMAANGYGNTAVTTVQDVSQIQKNTWIHVAVTYDAATTTMKLYKNGSLIATNTSAPSYITSMLQIGAQEYGDFFDGGDIDEVRLWNVARTQAQIQAAMNCDIPQQSGLVAYYRFNQGTIGGDNTQLTSVYDYSGNANCGTMMNFNLTGTTQNYIAGAISTCNAITIVNTAPAAIAGASAVCEGSSIELSNSVAGGVWGIDEIDTANISETGIVTGNYAGSVNVTYKTCGGSVSKLITVNPSPVVAATAANGSITASATGGTSPYSYNWSNNATTATVSNLVTGTYSVTVTDAKGCKDTGSYYVTGSVILTNAISVKACNTVYTGGDAHIIYLGYGAQSVTLTANPTGASSFSYSWTPATYLNNTYSKSVTFTPTKAGVYTITNTATNNGHAVSATVTITVIDAVDHNHYGCILTTHCSPCNKGRKDTKSVKCSDVNKQLRNNHSDRLGACGSSKSATIADTKGMLILGNDLNVTTYPNPFTEGVNVKVAGPAEFADVIVYDLSGRMVESKIDQSVGLPVAIGSTLTNGIYILEVKSGEQTKRMRIVKSN